MTSRAHETASAQGLASAQRASSTQAIQRGMLVRLARDGHWLQVVQVVDAFYIRVEDLLTGERQKICVWDIDRWG